MDREEGRNKKKNFLEEDDILEIKSGMAENGIQTIEKP